MTKTYQPPTQKEIEQVSALEASLKKALSKFAPYRVSISADRVSRYIGFSKLPNGLNHKVRISNHNERDRYGYKWQLRIDGLSNINKKKWSRYFDNVTELVKDFNRYYHIVAKSDGGNNE